MNLDNGACGPDGCHGEFALDHGHRNFIEVVSVSMALALIAGLLMWFYVAKVTN